jgi:hypothetical protein
MLIAECFGASIETKVSIVMAGWKVVSQRRVRLMLCSLIFGAGQPKTAPPKIEANSQCDKYSHHQYYSAEEDLTPIMWS